MPAPTPTVVFDHAQPRVRFDRLSALIAGSVPGAGAGSLGVEMIDGWDSPASMNSNMMYEPFTKTAILTPAPLLPGWFTGGAGIYARLAKSHYTLATPSKWREIRNLHSGDIYLHADDVNEAARVTAAAARNRGFWLGWYAYNTTQDEIAQIEAGWEDGGSTNNIEAATTKFGLRVFSTGSVEVWRGGTMIAQQSIGRPKLTDKSEIDADADPHVARYTGVVILPFRKRQVLVMTQSRTGFIVTLDDIPESEEAPVIVSGNFFWKVPAAAGGEKTKATVQAAPLSFESSGHITSTQVFFREPPRAGDTPGLKAYWEQFPEGAAVVTPSLRKADNSGGFIADGTEFKGRIRVAVSGAGGSYTPFVYGALVEFPSFIEDTASDDEYDATNHTIGLTINVPEAPSDVTCTIELSGDMESEGFIKPDVLPNRPVLIQVGGADVIDGRSEPPERVETAVDDADRLTFEVRDAWKGLENYILREPVPLDGMTLTEAFEFLVRLPGQDTIALDIEDVPIKLSSGNASRSEGGFANLIEVGESAAEWLLRLQSQYEPRSLIGFVPGAGGISFRFITYDTLVQQEPDLTIWGAMTEALGADSNWWRRGYRSLRRQRLEPEANYVAVMGLDRRSRRPILSYKVDSNSADPTIPPSGQADHGLREIRYGAWADPEINEESLADEACRRLYRRVNFLGDVIEFEANILRLADGTPLWRSHKVAVEPFGDFVIRALSLTAIAIDEARGIEGWRARYIAEKLPDSALE